MAGWDYPGQAYFAQVAASAKNYWGVDSVTHADTPISGTTFFNLVKAQAGKPPAFWGRYIGSPNPNYNLTREEIGYLASQNCRILLIYNGHASSDTFPILDSAQGQAAATNAIQAARNLGIPETSPRSIWIYCDVEPDQTVMSGFFTAWFAGMGGSGYAAGIYGTPGTNFDGPFCSAYTSLPHDPPEYFYTTLNRHQLGQCRWDYRGFNVKRPTPCKPDTVILQYDIGPVVVYPDGRQRREGCVVAGADPGPPGQRVDLDVANYRGLTSMWAPPMRVVFWKFNPSTSVTQLLHSESGTAWTPADFGTTSAGQTNHLGQQVAVLRDKLLAMGDSPLAIYETSNLTSFTKRYGMDLRVAPTFDGRLILRGTTPWAAWSPSGLDSRQATVPGSRANADDPYAGDPAFPNGPFPWSGTQVSLPYSPPPGDGSRSNRRLDSQWAFTVPSDVVITGIKVTISTNFSGGPTSPTPSVGVWLRVGGQWSTVKWVPTYPQADLGGQFDLWDFPSIAVSDVNAPEFGVGIVALQAPSNDGSAGTLTLTSAIDSVTVYLAVSPRVWEDSGSSYIQRYFPTGHEAYLYHIVDALGTIWGTFTTILRKWIGGTSWQDVWTSSVTLDRSVYWPAQNRLMMARQNPASGPGVGEILAFDGTATPPPAVLPGITDRVGYMLAVGNDLYVMAVVTTNGVTGDTWRIYRCTDLNTAILIGQGTLGNTVIPTLALVWHPPTTAFYAAIGTTTLQKIYKAISPVSDASPVPIGQLTFSEVYSGSESASYHIRDGTVGYLR